LLVLVEKASFSKEFWSEFHGGGGGKRVESGPKIGPATGVTIGSSPILQSRIVSNVQFLTFSILIVDLNNQRYEVQVVDQDT